MLEKSMAQTKKKGMEQSVQRLFGVFIRPSVQFCPDPATFPQWRPTVVVTLVRLVVLLAAQQMK